MLKDNLIHTPVGVRDVYGKELKRKELVEERLSATIAGYGYESIETPTFEFFDVFSGDIGTTNEKELYKFFDKEGNTLVLRPDFTPSVARCAAKYFSTMEEDLRLSYIGSAYTNTNELQGKLKETTQMGAELIGNDSVEADAEMIALVVDSLLKAGLSEFQIMVGQIDYFKGIVKEVGLDEQVEMKLRDYISVKNLFGAREYLTDAGVAEADIDKLLTVFDLYGQSDVLDAAGKAVTNETSRQAILRLKMLYERLCNYGVQKYISFDLGMLSKYHYYTGVLFKAYTYGVGDAIVKGGRYDNLLAQFGTKKAAVGFVILVDELLNAMNRQKIELPVEAEMVTITYNDSNYCDCLEEAKVLRAQGVRVRLIGERV